MEDENKEQLVNYLNLFKAYIQLGVVFDNIEALKFCTLNTKKTSRVKFDFEFLSNFQLEKPNNISEVIMVFWKQAGPQCNFGNLSLFLLLARLVCIPCVGTLFFGQWDVSLQCILFWVSFLSSSIHSIISLYFFPHVCIICKDGVYIALVGLDPLFGSD